MNFDVLTLHVLGTFERTLKKLVRAFSELSKAGSKLGSVRLLVVFFKATLRQNGDTIRVVANHISILAIFKLMRFELIF